MMLDKVRDLFGSIRFWVVSLGWASDYLAKVAADGFDMTVLFAELSFWLGSVAVIGTADSIANNFSRRK